MPPLAHDDAVTRQVVESRGCIIERIHMGAMQQGDLAVIDLEIAHQPLDHCGTQDILVRECDALGDRQHTSLDGPAPARDIGRILHIALRQASDGGRAERQQRICGIHRIALKIPVQGAVARRLRHRIVRPREMIEADHVVSFRHEHIACSLLLRHALGRTRQGGRIDELLMHLEPRHMRIAEDGQSRG